MMSVNNGEESTNNVAQEEVSLAPDIAMPAVPEEVEDDDAAPAASDQQQHPNQSRHPFIGDKIKAVVSRAVHDTKVTSTVMKNHTKTAAQKTTQTVTTAVNRVRTTIATTTTTGSGSEGGGLRLRRGQQQQQQQQQHHQDDSDNNNNNNNEKKNRATASTTIDLNDDSEISITNVRGDNHDDDDDDEALCSGNTATNSPNKGSSSGESHVKSTSNSSTAPRNNDDTSITTATTTYVTFGPLMEFLTADMTIVFIFTISAAFYPLYEHYDLLFPTTNLNEQLQVQATPIFILTRIAVPWMIAAFAFGLALGQYMGDDFRWWDMVTTTTANTDSNDLRTGGNDDINVLDDDNGTEATQQQLQRDPMKESIKTKHTLFMTLLGSNRSSRVQFRHSIKNGGQISKTTALEVTKKLRQQPVKVWTTLTNTSKELSVNKDVDVSTAFTSSQQQHSKPRSFRLLPWQRHATPTDDGYLMQHLLKHESFRKLVRKNNRRQSTDQNSVAMTTGDESKIDTAVEGQQQQQQQQEQQSQHLGSFDLSSTVAESLDGFVIAPLFQLRGMDIFLSGDDIPETESSTHPFLIENGLRSVPTFIVNVLTQWGNILIYFEMPHWVRSFKMSVGESDPDDVKALKRFLNGDANYRNERLKMMPSLVDGPLPIRMVAPPKREKVVNCDWMPITWNQQDEVMNSDGTILYPIVEATLDCMTSRAIRSMAGLVKKYLHHLSVDVAIVIGTPENQNEVEPSACLGLWRFDHIEISQCPNLPDRYESAKVMNAMSGNDDDSVVLAADIQRASIAIKEM